MRKVLTILAAVLLVASCREPRSREQFVPGAEGPFRFTVDMSDSLRLYDLDFYTRLDGSHEDLASDVEASLRLVWTTPSGQQFEEQVYLPLSGSGKTWYSRQICVPYREGIIPRDPGLWTLDAYLQKPVPGLRGLGLITRKRD